MWRSSPHFGKLYVLSNIFLLLGSFRIVGSGDTINFWHDIWYNNYPLSMHFPLVYAKTKYANITLAEVWNSGNIKLHLTEELVGPCEWKKPN
jgi:hypothetical protein